MISMKIVHFFEEYLMVIIFKRTDCTNEIFVIQNAIFFLNCSFYLEHFSILSVCTEISVTTLRNVIHYINFYIPSSFQNTIKVHKAINLSNLYGRETCIFYVGGKGKM